MMRVVMISDAPSRGWLRGVNYLRWHMAALGVMIGDPVVRDSAECMVARIEGTIRAIREFGTREQIEAAETARAALVHALRTAIRSSVDAGGTS